MEVVKFLLHSDWGGEGAKTAHHDPSPTKSDDSTQLSSPEQQEQEQEQEEEETPQEERKTELPAEQQKSKDDSEKKHQEAQSQQQHEAFRKSHAIQQALVAAASMGHIEVIISCIIPL